MAITASFLQLGIVAIFAGRAAAQGLNQGCSSYRDEFGYEHFFCDQGYACDYRTCKIASGNINYGLEDSDCYNTATVIAGYCKTDNGGMGLL